MMRSIVELLQYENAVFRNYAFWTAFLLFKTGLMSLLPAFQPLIIKYIVRPKPDEAEAVLQESLERVRGAHRNDLENIVPIALIWFLYTLTDPLEAVAVNLFRVIVAFRLWHTIVYAIYPIRQPARGIGFIVPYIIMLYMAVQTMVTFVG